MRRNRHDVFPILQIRFHILVRTVEFDHAVGAPDVETPVGGHGKSDGIRRGVGDIAENAAAVVQSQHELCGVIEAVASGIERLPRARGNRAADFKTGQPWNDVDCVTGVLKDSILLDAYIPASPASFGQYCYVGDYSGNIYEVELSVDEGFVNMRKLVKSDEENGSFVSVPAVDSKQLYALSGDRYLYAVNRIDGEQAWRYLMKGQTGESSPVVCDDKILVCTKTGIVSILNAQNGELLWEYDTGEQILGSPAIIQDHFFILTSRGTLFCFGEKGA